MKALTIRQPYTQAIVRGTKTVENRTRNTNHRGRLLVHAGVAIHEHFRGTDPAQFPLGAIVGEVEIVDSHEATTCGTTCLAGGGFVNGVDPAEPGRMWGWHWVLVGAVEYHNPITDVRGALGFWQPTEAVLLEAAYGDRRRA
jgi:hypothetical protein